MSDGAFAYGKYTTNYGLVTVVKVQPETITLALGGAANAETPGSVADGTPSAKVSGTQRSIGINARTVSFRTTADGTGASAGILKGSRLTVPVFDPVIWKGYSKGNTGTYKGIPIVYAGKRDEQIN